MVKYELTSIRIIWITKDMEKKKSHQFYRSFQNLRLSVLIGMYVSRINLINLFMMMHVCNLPFTLDHFCLQTLLNE